MEYAGLQMRSVTWLHVAAHVPARWRMTGLTAHQHDGRMQEREPLPPSFSLSLLCLRARAEPGAVIRLITEAWRVADGVIAIGASPAISQSMMSIGLCTVVSRCDWHWKELSRQLTIQDSLGTGKDNVVGRLHRKARYGVKA